MKAISLAVLSLLILNASAAASKPSSSSSKAPPASSSSVYVPPPPPTDLSLVNTRVYLNPKFVAPPMMGFPMGSVIVAG